MHDSARYRTIKGVASQWRWAAAAAVIVGVGIGLAVVANRPVAPPEDPAIPTAVPDSTPAPPQPRLVPLKLNLPKAVFEGTGKNIKPSPYLEKYNPDKPRPPLMVPEGTVSIARDRPVTSSDSEPVVGQLSLITDGDKEGTEGCYADLGPGKQWVQIDLKQSVALHVIVLWHYHAEARVYHDVVIQAADDPDFIENVHTVYNNDYDNSSGLGIGKDLEYIEDYRGRAIPLGGIRARYVRLYSKGNTSNDQNHYVEVEVYGTRPQR